MITNGVHFTVNDSSVGKDVFIPYGSKWLTFSALAKGSGTIRMRLLLACLDNGAYVDKYVSCSYTLEDQTEWLPLTVCAVVPDNIALDRSSIVQIFMDSEAPDIILCAPKLEASSEPTLWTPSPADFPVSGTTAERPTSVPVGYTYFDTTLSPARPVFYTGSKWVDATGADV